jgi:hypothetical protein
VITCSAAVRLGTGNHIDLYDVPQFVGPAVDEALAWFYTHLRPPA